MTAPKPFKLLSDGTVLELTQVMERLESILSAARILDAQDAVIEAAKTHARFRQISTEAALVAKVEDLRDIEDGTD